MFSDGYFSIDEINEMCDNGEKVNLNKLVNILMHSQKDRIERFINLLKQGVKNQIIMGEFLDKTLQHVAEIAQRYREKNEGECKKCFFIIQI